jgi:hypothetical protein
MGTFRWSTHGPTTTTGELVGDLNLALRGLGHDLAVQQSLLTLRKRAAPATVTGIAQIYIDTADDDLKVRFGDGVTKVIATDP